MLEVLVSVTLLGVGIVAALAALSMCLRTGGRAAALERASGIAHGHLAETLAKPRDLQVPLRGSEGRFAYELTIADRSESLRMISVRVTWLGHGQPRQYERAELVYLPQDEAG